MALVLKDRVKETSTTTGTGTFTLAGTSAGFQAFSVIGDGNTTYYTIVLQGGSEFEVGLGTYTLSGTTLARTTILASSNSNNAVNFSAGTKDVFVTYPAGKSINADASNVVNTPGAIIAPQAGSTIPFYFVNQAAFPSAATYHGALAHSHSDGAMYFAHSSVWVKLLDENTDVTVSQGGTGASTLTGIIKGNGTAAFTAATAGTDYVAPSGALGTPSSGTLSSCTVDGTNLVGYLNIPQNSQSAAYTLVIGDSGKHIFHPVGDNNARTFTIPANSSVAYPIGTAITFINMAVANVTIAITTDTLTLSPAGTAGSRTLATNGSATCIKITSTQWLISGSGLT